MMARRFLLAILLIIVLTFLVAYGWHRVQSSYEPEFQDIEQIYAVQEVFIDSHSPLITLDIDFFYPTIAHFDLLIPKDELKGVEWGKDLSILSSSNQCGSASKVQGLLAAQFKKDEIWEHFRCGLINYLPQDFFSIPPFLHPSGQSYAYLAFNLNQTFKRKSWLLDHLMHFHVSELHKVEDSMGRLPSLFHYLAAMDNANLMFLERKIDPILVDKFILFPLQRDQSSLIHKYDVYLFEQFEDFLSPTLFSINIVRKAKLCFYTQGQLCWNITPTQIWKHVSLRTILAVLFLVGVIVSLIWLLFIYLKRASIEDEQRKLALQILGHELRTPIASMLLHLEHLTEKIDKFDEASQDAIWGLSINSQRLRRLVEMTQSYLMLKSQKKSVLIKPNIIDSLNDFFNEICDEFPGTEFVPLKEDTAFNTDAHWLSICVKNILGNAHSHGKKPVKLILHFHSDSKKWIEVIVQDDGDCEYATLEQMCQEFVKGKQSQGTGLGLNIVIKVLKAIGGELSFHAHPTTFTLKLREGNYE
jgi:signal transduction histidine kinase